ncbi:ABC transporter substrate-binding protein [Microbacterium sp. NPDC090225]|uniref:ABC transporter substrate-binding protein n=1 Tax=Microbacterium sp. NPDC090225 TaxID=3364207 RepID=UPI0037F4A60A
MTLQIREGQEFTSGDVLNAQAVAESLEAARQGPSTAASLSAIASVEAPDPSTVTLKLSKPDAALVPLFS